MLELHCHTTYSDGTLTPTALVQAAIAAGVTVLAITDHDTLAGWDEAVAAAQAAPTLELVPGVELSTMWRGKSIHILGYYPDRDRLAAYLTPLQTARQHRAQVMAHQLAELGYPIALPPVNEAMVFGRPHVAQALVAAGYVPTVQAAFERWLYEGGPAYVAPAALPTTVAIQLLRACGAVPVWAHPVLWRGGTVAAALPELVAAGLMGLEVCHPSYSARDQRRLKTWCDRYQLLQTGGTDYHSPLTGPALNHYQLPASWLTEMKQRRDRLITA